MATRYIIELKDESRRGFVEELLRQFSFLKIRPEKKAKRIKLTKKELEFQKGLHEAIREMQADLSGKKKLPTLKEALHELRR
ncbi:MAG: hypothetical protein WAT74_17025 [Flavobacteriales bacterium]